MDDPHKNRLKPINPPERKASPSAPDTPFGILSRFVRFLCVVLGLIAIGVSFYMFMGFVENDKGIGHLASALTLCLTVGALAFMPLACITHFSHYSYYRGPSRRYAVLTLLFVIPWMVVGGLLIPNGGIWPVIGAIIIVASLIIGFWAVVSWVQFGRIPRSRTDK